MRVFKESFKDSLPARGAFSYKKKKGKGPARGGVSVEMRGRIFDDMAQMAMGAADFAQNCRQEFEMLIKTQAEHWIRSLDLIKREEFEMVKAVALAAREENSRLQARLSELEAEVKAYRSSDVSSEQKL